jgi:hypothetical protein
MSVNATVQESWRGVLARVFARDVSDTQQEIVRFKIGEGGFTGAPKVPISPDATYLDLESEGAALGSGGTGSFTNGSAIVTGTGTQFTVDCAPGEWIKPGPDFTGGVGSEFGSAGDPGSEHDTWGQILTVDNDLQITLTANYAGSTIAGREVRLASEPLFTFRKTLVAGDVLLLSTSPAIDEITAIVAAGEANADQLANNPEFFELGLFDANGVMLVYVTFDLETKSGAVQLNHIIQLVF